MKQYSNERLSHDESEYAISSLLEFDKEQRTVIDKLIKAGGLTKVDLKLKRSLYIHEFIALSDAGFIDVRKMYQAVDKPCEYPTEESKEFGLCLEKLPEETRLSFLRCTRSLVSDFYVQYLDESDSIKKQLDRVERGRYNTFTASDWAFESFNMGETLDEFVLKRIVNLMKRKYPKSTFLQIDDLDETILQIIRFKSRLYTLFKPTIKLSVVRAACQYISISPHWLLSLTDTTPLLSDVKWVDPCVDAFLLMPDASRAAVSSLAKSLAYKGGE